MSHFADDETIELLQQLRAENEALKQQVTEANSTVRDAAQIMLSQEREIEALKQQVEQGERDAEPVAWGISVEGEICDLFINRDDCVMEFERRNKLYPRTPRVMVNLAIAAAPKQEGDDKPDNYVSCRHSSMS